jgi:hypothetical protein
LMRFQPSTGSCDSCHGPGLSWIADLING